MRHLLKDGENEAASQIGANEAKGNRGRDSGKEGREKLGEETGSGHGGGGGRKEASPQRFPCRGKTKAEKGTEKARRGHSPDEAAAGFGHQRPPFRVLVADLLVWRARVRFTFVFVPPQEAFGSREKGDPQNRIGARRIRRVMTPSGLGPFACCEIRPHPLKAPNTKHQTHLLPALGQQLLLGPELPDRSGQAGAAGHDFAALLTCSGGERKRERKEGAEGGPAA